MKTKKPLWRISVTTSIEAEDAVSELLGGLSDAAAAAYFNLETGVSTVSVFFDRKPDAKKITAEIAAGLKNILECGLKIGAGLIEIVKVKREDWAESWKRHFHPLEIGAALLVKPSWIKQRPKKGQAVVILDPRLELRHRPAPDDFVLSVSNCSGGWSRSTLTERRYNQIIFGHRHGFGDSGDFRNKTWFSANSRL